MKLNICKVFALLLLMQGFALANTQTLVHLFEWSWKDIASECEKFLGPNGYSAVQVSPPYEHKVGPQWWVRYQPVTHELSTSRSGTASEFVDMVQRCNRVGVDIYVDAVLNHVAAGSGVGTAGSTFDANSLRYPLFSSPDFHQPRCDIQQSDYTNNAYRVRNCDLVNLPDLNTDNDYVLSILARYLNNLIHVGVKGFRIDAAKHMHPNDLKKLYDRLDNKDVYLYHEVIDNGNEAIGANEYTFLGDVTEFKYSGAVSNRFLNGGIADLKNIEQWGFLPSNKALVFTDNHDNQRGHGSGGNIITFHNPKLYKIANAFMLAWPYGTPRVMSSYSFNDSDQGPPAYQDKINCNNGTWQCEHRWPEIANMVKFRKATQQATQITHWQQDGDNRIAFGRGNVGFIAINRTNSTWNATLKTSMPPGQYCDAFQGQCQDKLSVNTQSELQVAVPAYSAQVIYVDEVNLQPPVAFIQAQTSRTQVGKKVFFDGKDSFSPNGKIILWYWSWQPGLFNKSLRPKINIDFDKPGIYSVNLHVIDDHGQTSKTVKYPFIVDQNAKVRFPSLYYRASSNNWSLEPMYILNTNTWAIELDLSATDRFKVDVRGNWGENYGTGANQSSQLVLGGDDISVTQAGRYQLQVNDKTLKWSLHPISQDNSDFAKTFPSLYYRGTSNQWNATPMKLIANHTWAIDLNLSGSGDNHGPQRFKVDVLGDWSQNYGAAPNQIHTLIENGLDIDIPQTGYYQLQINDHTLQWSLNPQ